MVNKNTFLDYLKVYKDLKRAKKALTEIIIINLESGEYGNVLKNQKKLKNVLERIEFLEKMEMKYHNQL